MLKKSRTSKGVPSAPCHELGYHTKQQGTGIGNYRQLTPIPSPRHLILILVGFIRI